MKQAVEICVVLDRSGSMENCRSDAIGAVNSCVRKIRADSEMDARVSVIIFDSQSIDCIRDRVKVGNCPDVSEAEYEPRAMTPLLDAVGHGAGRLAQDERADVRKILVIMTDGLENASREHTTESIAALLRRRQDKDGWLVVYLGADHDAWAQSSALGIRDGNVAALAKVSFAISSGVLYARSKRYSSAETPEAGLDAGFSDEERDALKD